MSRKSGRTPSFKALRESYNDISPPSPNHVLIVSSPIPSATLSSALLCKWFLKSGILFHLTFSEPIMNIDTINELRKAYEDSAMIVVGIDIIGDKRLRKGSSYPLFLGSQSECSQIEERTIGNRTNIAAASYAYTMGNNETADPKLLQLAAAGAIVDDFPNLVLKGASKQVVGMAEKEKLIEESKGFRLFGVNFLQLKEVLTYSIRPYLQNLSGVLDACDRICIDADIPFSKFSMPLNALSSLEATRFNERLLPLIDPRTIPYVLGQDYVLTQEKEDSLARLLSGIKTLAEFGWTVGEWGTLTAIWMGNREGSLRGRVLDAYKLYSLDVIAGVEECIETLLKSSESLTKGKTTRISTKAIRRETLADVGRILIESGQVETPCVVLKMENSLEMIWKMNSRTLQEVIPLFWKVGISAESTSSQSIRIEAADDTGNTAMQIIEEIW
ncbi:MAG: hypothetical protein EAX81_07550 [Candidatus Thorarchaeota archaeon]|nr:hypothetical protein [Candidatus Thorarchaeota archaeon]